MRLAWLGLVGVLACGSVKRTPDVIVDAAVDAAVLPSVDASPDVVDGASVDAQNTCTIHDTVESCGATCEACPPAAGRKVPICNGTTCEVACARAAPACTDGSCSQLTWSFDSNSLEGITPRAPAGLVLAVRNHNGNLALGIDVANLAEVSFKVPICLSGNIQLQTKTLTAKVFFDGGTATGNQYYVQTSVPAPMTGAYLVSTSMASGIQVTYSAPITMSQFANTATDVVFQAGSFGAQFSGTVWFDDITIE